jgi:tRNA(Ile2)-agmatinylcytidine synthase
VRLWVGIDDTDSAKGMCTTYLALQIIRELERLGDRLIGFPRLIRLNPTIPYKTRGNGAVSFMIETENPRRVIDVVNEKILELAEMDDADPGAVFIDAERDEVLDTLSAFAIKAVRNVITVDEAFFIIGKYLLPHLKYKSGRGLIGSLAAVGLELHDYTFELLVYRKPERFGKRREHDKESFFRADEETYPLTWDTVDRENDVVVAVPNSPDPILYGIRGDSIEAIRKASSFIIAEEKADEMIFITNQGTDMHIIPPEEVSELKDHQSYVLRGKVVERPYDIEGGHVFFVIETVFGDITCAAFEPTKQFRKIIRMLDVGDEVEVYGSMKNGTLNLEKINVLRVAEIYIEENPTCSVCGRRMESAGKDQGFRCRKCKTRAHTKVKRKVERELKEGFYEVPPSARRHLSKPLVRMDVEKKHIFR